MAFTNYASQISSHNRATWCEQRLRLHQREPFWVKSPWGARHCGPWPCLLGLAAAQPGSQAKKPGDPRVTIAITVGWLGAKTSGSSRLRKPRCPRNWVPELRRISSTGRTKPLTSNAAKAQWWTAYRHLSCPKNGGHQVFELLSCAVAKPLARSLTTLSRAPLFPCSLPPSSCPLTHTDARILRKPYRSWTSLDLQGDQNKTVTHNFAMTTGRQLAERA